MLQKTGKLIGVDYKRGWKVRDFYKYYNFCYIPYIIYNNNALSLHRK